MIDAYEIGIQLLLQDDVSAGLVVINQGLAEVDRAIAATSADLAGLVREASQATKAVASATPGRVGSAVLPQSSVVSPAENVGAPGLGRAMGPAPARVASALTAPGEPIRGETVVAPVSLATALPANAVERTAVDHPVEAVAPRSPVSPIAPSSEVSTAARELTPERVASTPSVSPEPAVVTPSIRAEPQEAIPASTGTAPGGRPALAPLPNVFRETALVSNAPVAMTASVNQSRVAAQTGGGQVALQQAAPQVPSRQRERPVASWGTSAQQGQARREMRPAERAAAPAASARDQGGSSGGSVMLDGRLVGQWLADHMGREASRPPSGTTFFDPRQTPAWNIAGAL